jgi:hypothetical protein
MLTVWCAGRYCNINSACYLDHVEEHLCQYDNCYQYQHHDGMVTDDNTCYHFKVVDDEELAIMHARTKEIMNMIGANLDEIMALSQVCLPQAGAFDVGKQTPVASNINQPIQQVRTSLLVSSLKSWSSATLFQWDQRRRRGNNY